MTPRPRTLLATGLLVTALAVGPGMASGASDKDPSGKPGNGASARPERPERPTTPSRPTTPTRPTTPVPVPATPITPVPSRPTTPVTPVNPITRPVPVTTPSNGGRPTGSSPATGSGSGGGATGSGSAAPSGSTTAPSSLPPVPRGIRTAGLSAGRGPVQVRYFADLGSVATSSGHLANIPVLLDRIAADGLGTMVLRPLVVSGDANSTEAACAILAASGSNRTWQVAHRLAAARVTTDGDWVTRASLTAIAGKVGGLRAAPFVRTAMGRACFPQLNRLRQEARAAGVGSSPSYVVSGAGGTTRVAAPASADEVIAAIRSVG